MHLSWSWRRSTLLGPVAAFAFAGALSLPATSFAAPPAHQLWLVNVGAQSSDEGRQTNFFYSREITVDVGDQVRWTQNADELHTVTFLAPGQTRNDVPLFTFTSDFSNIVPNLTALAPQGDPTKFDGTALTSSGAFPVPGAPPGPPHQYTVTFTKAGDYDYVCLVHATMSGTIHVRASGTPYPQTQAQYDLQAHILQAQRLGQTTALAAQGLAAAVSSGGTRVTAGIGQLFNTGSFAVLRFEPDKKLIHAGEKVTWTNLDPETPHTVTFGTEPPGGPLGAYPPSGTDGPGHATISSPSQSVSSGFVLNGLPPPTPPLPPHSDTFSVTFTQPGVYPYICALHDDLGMKGVITVLP